MKIDKNKIITVDFETYYAVGYSLTSKDINMSEYVRDPRFKTHCLAIKIGEAPVRVIEHKDIASELAKIDWSDKLVLAHNAAFDGFILSDRYGIHPLGYLDTLSMSRAIYGAHLIHRLDMIATRLNVGVKEKKALTAVKGVVDLPEELLTPLMEYCGNDVELCYNIFWKLYPAIPDSELQLIDLTLKMFCRPRLIVDADLAQEEHAHQLAKKEEALKKVEALGITREDLMSNPKFVRILVSRGLDVPMKTSKTTGKPAPALAKGDPEFQAFLNHEDETTKAIFHARLAVKTTINETRAKRLLTAGSGAMSLPIMLNYYGAHTGRWSGGNKLNLQNLPRGGRLRRSLKAPRGNVIVVADSSQIEARTTAWLAGQNDILDAFRERKDLYRQMAASIYGGSPEDASDLQRFVGKTCILGLGYGMGGSKLKTTLGLGVNGPKVELSQQDANSIVRLYRKKYPKIVILWEIMQSIIPDMIEGNGGEFKCISWSKDRILLPNGMRLLYPGVRNEVQDDSYPEYTYKTRLGFSKIYGGLLTENVVQALARIIIADQMLKISERYEIVTMSHDEIVWIAPEKEAEESFAWGKQIMSTPPAWAKGLPLGASGGFDERYSK